MRIQNRDWVPYKHSDSGFESNLITLVAQVVSFISLIVYSGVFRGGGFEHPP